MHGSRSKLAFLRFYDTIVCSNRETTDSSISNYILVVLILFALIAFYVDISKYFLHFEFMRGNISTARNRNTGKKLEPS
jgi:hypothetical protein